MKKAFFAAALLVAATAAFARTDAIGLVPNDAVSVGVVKLAELRSSPLSGALFQQTDTASLGTSDIASLFATAAGAMAARRTAAQTNSFFMSELLSSEQPGSEDETSDRESGGGEKDRRRRRSAELAGQRFVGHE